MCVYLHVCVCVCVCVSAPVVVPVTYAQTSTRSEQLCARARACVCVSLCVCVCVSPGCVLCMCATTSDRSSVSLWRGKIRRTYTSTRTHTNFESSISRASTLQTLPGTPPWCVCVCVSAHLCQHLRSMLLTPLTTLLHTLCTPSCSHTSQLCSYGPSSQLWCCQGRLHSRFLTQSIVAVMACCACLPFRRAHTY